MSSDLNSTRVHQNNNILAYQPNDVPKIKVADYYASTEPVLPHPVSAVAISSTEVREQWATCRELASEFLTSQGFHWKSVTILNMRGSNSAALRTELIIDVESVDERHRWKDIIIPIYRMLSQQDCLGLGVEIIAPDPSRDMRIFAVEADNALVKTWPNLEKQIVGLLPPCEWALDVLRYGKTFEESEPTIFVPIKEEGDDGDDEWSSLKEKIKGIACHIPVEVRVGQPIWS